MKMAAVYPAQPAGALPGRRVLSPLPYAGALPSAETAFCSSGFCRNVVEKAKRPERSEL